MVQSALRIRHADEDDASNIYRLQFCEGWLLSSSEIARNLRQLYVPHPYALARTHLPPHIEHAIAPGLALLLHQPILP